MGRFADHRMSAWVVAGFALLIAAIGARPYAGGWNDGSRLAAVESLIERRTLTIDESVFVTPPRHLVDNHTAPYPADRLDLLLLGTQDKLRIDGRFHSDKPPVISIVMAALYEPLTWLGLPRPAARPDVFAWVMTLLTSGAGYAAAAGCLWALGTRIGLPAAWRLAWIASFALSTFALAYTRHVNNHAVQLGAVAGICLLLLKLADATRNGRSAWAVLLGLGTLAGLGFNLDFGSGPLLVAAVFAAVALRTRRVGPILAFSLTALPWVVAGVGLNYATGGDWKPPNMNPAYLDWPGSPFGVANMTGLSRHGFIDQLLYAGALLFGKHGFWNHNLPVLLAMTAGWAVLRREFVGRVELLILLGWCAGTWLAYAVLSNNAGGGCCSIRWFVSFLAPSYWLLGVLLRERPEFRADFAALSVWGAVLAGIMWWKGPWVLRMVPLMWPVVGAAVLTWVVVVRRRVVAGRAAVLEITTPVAAVRKAA